MAIKFKTSIIQSCLHPRRRSSYNLSSVRDTWEEEQNTEVKTKMGRNRSTSFSTRRRTGDVNSFGIAKPEPNHIRSINKRNELNNPIKTHNTNTIFPRSAPSALMTFSVRQTRENLLKLPAFLLIGYITPESNFLKSSYYAHFLKWKF